MLRCMFLLIDMMKILFTLKVVTYAIDVSVKQIMLFGCLLHRTKLHIVIDIQKSSTRPILYKYYHLHSSVTPRRDKKFVSSFASKRCHWTTLRFTCQKQ